MAIFLSIRPPAWLSVGRMLLRPYTGTQKNGNFSFRSTTGVVVCEAYAIRPYPVGRKFIGVLVRFYSENQKSDWDWIHLASDVAVCGAYAVASYTDRRKPGWFLVRFWPGKGKMAGDSMNRHPRKGVWGCSIVVVRFLDHMPGLHFEVTVDYIDG